MPFCFRRSPGNRVSFRIFVASPSPIELVSSPESEPALESADIKTLLTSIRLSFSYHVLRPVSLLSSTDGHPPSIYTKFLETLSVGTKGARGKTNTC